MKESEPMDEHDTLLRLAYRDAARAEPSPTLDARILTAARQATAVKPAPRHTGWWRWLVPASSLAVLVLAIGVVLRVQHEAPESIGVEADLRQAPAAISASPPSPSQPQATPQVLADSTEDAAAVAPSRRAEESPRALAPPARKDVASKARVPADADQAEVRPAAQAENAYLGGAAQARMAAPPPPALSSSTPRAFPAQEAVAEHALAPAAPAPRALPESARLPADAALDAAPAMAAKHAPRLQSKAAPASDGAIEAAIEAIRAQARAGRLDEARRLLREFQASYPDHDLPEDLRALRGSAAKTPGQ